jgi:hypothetical protein
MFFLHVHLPHKIDAKKYPAELSPVSGAEIKPPATTTVCGSLNLSLAD